ncbi:MAG: hypothetical protein KatS3mg010_2153 [Acidimicrobiia bacterium]|nr:MAG: hypothetical protein KatS3mg010_2153 [Acidimicrobiia bacterium]
MLAGMRIEPPPSPACPTGTMPLATAAADPPLEPPELCCVFHGLRVGPCDCGSAVGSSPNSGVLVLPTITNPAPSSFSKRWLVVRRDVLQLLQQSVAAVVRRTGERPVEVLHDDRHAAERPVGQAVVARGAAARGRTAGG